MELRCQSKKEAELWNILPYAGVWPVMPNRPVTNFLIPRVKKTYMIGTPYTTDTTPTGNPNLRLINFVPSSTDGPVTSADIQTVFIDNYLVYTVKWKITPITPVKDVNSKGVNIGFYTATYTNASFKRNGAIPLITSEGPSL